MFFVNQTDDKHKRKNYFRYLVGEQWDSNLWLELGKYLDQ